MKRVILILLIETSEWEKKILFADTSYVPILYICILCLSVSSSVNNFKLNDFLSVCLSVTKAHVILSAISPSMIFYLSVRYNWQKERQKTI